MKINDHGRDECPLEGNSGKAPVQGIGRLGAWSGQVALPGRSRISPEALSPARGEKCLRALAQRLPEMAPLLEAQTVDELSPEGWASLQAWLKLSPENVARYVDEIMMTALLKEALAQR